MTAHTPASKASSVSALLASLSTVPPQPEPSAKEDFLAVILQALTAQPGGTDSPPSAKPAKDPEKPSPKDAPAPDVTAASLLLAWMAPPLPNLPQLPAHKASAPSNPIIPSGPPAQSAPAQTPGEAKPAKAADTEKMPLAPALAPLAKEPESEPSPPSTTPAVAEKLPPALVVSSPLKEPENKSTPPSGTSAANTSQRMSLTPERNEIAGRTEQKLPPAAISAVSSADTGGSSSDGGEKSSLAFTWHEAPSEPLTITDLSTLADSPLAPVTQAIVDAPARAVNAAPMERLENVISREAVMIRQSGAQTLGVSMRLDSNTQIFLQLTSHNGEVQASVRCERGNFAPEDTQWAQLQQSLARQNVALLPMTGGSNLNFQQPSGERSRQQAAAREDWAAAGLAVQPAQPRKQKEQNHPRKNWESWA
jgi:hypothetical protein